MSADFQMRVNAEGVVSLLRSNLIDRYKDCFCIIQELLQNADDADATHVHFGVSQGLNVDHPLGRLPALYIINDGPVSRSNMKAIYTVASGDKGDQKNKIGKFGLGMKSVFHVCEGFFMFGEGLDNDLAFPYFCTPWTEEYHEDWFIGLDDARKQMDLVVRECVKGIVDGWERWFCVWLPLRVKAQHDNNLTEPIIQTYPTDADLDEFTGRDNASRAAHMLPLMRNVKHLSFVDRRGNSRLFHLESSGRMTGGSGRLSGVVHASGEGLVDFIFSGVEKIVENIELSKLKESHHWPHYTRFVKDGEKKGLKSFPDKTDSHVALCFLAENDEDPTLTVSPCVYLPLSDVREDENRARRGERREYTKLHIGGKSTVTIDLHGNLFVDAGRQEFSISAPLGRDPSTEQELREEWNRRIYENGILPEVIPELFSALQSWDDETVGSVMGALREVPFFSRWMADVCRTEGIAKELTPDGYKWVRISSDDAVFAIDPPRSPIVRKVIATALPTNAHVIDATSGRLLKPGIVRTEFTPEISEFMLRAIVALDAKEADNEVLRQFAQECAASLDFAHVDDFIRDAPIWKAGDCRYSYNELVAQADKRKLYCHAEGDLRNIFLAAVECSPIQITEPLVKALCLSVPNFTYDFVLDLLQGGPTLRSVECRRKLLERLLHAVHVPGDPRWVKACRYLVHGERKLLDRTEPLFMPVDGDNHEFSEKIVDVLSRHKYGASCKVSRVITDILDRASAAELSLPLSTAENLVCALAEIDGLSSEGFAANDWQTLVMMVQNPFEQPNVVEALRRIPLYPTEDGGMTALAGNAYYEKEYVVAPPLRPFLRILKIDGEERLMRRMWRLANKWNPNACIAAAGDFLTDIEDYVPVVADALTHAESIDPSVAERLRDKAWVRMADGRYLAPRAIMNLPCVSGKVAGCDTVAEVADAATAKVIRSHALVLGQQSSVDRLFSAMAAAPDGRYALGEFKGGSGNLQTFDVSAALAIFPESIQENLPALGVLRILRNNHIAFNDQLPKLQRGLAPAVLVSVLNTLTDRTDDEKIDQGACWKLLAGYLDEAARREDFASDIRPHLRFRNTSGALKNPRELCVGATGVPSKYILSDRYAAAGDFMRAVEIAVKEHPRDDSQKQMSIAEYFSDWLPVLSEFEDRIGGFMICCTDQEDDLAVVRTRYGFENKSIAETRNSIADTLDDYLGQQHCYVLATPDERIRVIAIDGSEMDVSLSPLESAKDLLSGQFNQCEIVKNSCLWSMGHPPMPADRRSLIVMLRKLDRTTLTTFSPERLDSLLFNTLSVILRTYGFGSANVDAYWQSLKHVEQLDVRVTKSVILQSLDMYLPQIRCKNEELKAIFKESRRLQYSEEQARLNEKHQQESRYREERMELHRKLERSITDNVELQSSILDALRERVRGFSYNIDSILFELFQNADDAYEEMYQLCGQMAINMPNRFDVRFDGRNLIVAHWGRPINQAKVGAEMNPKFDEYRVDLQKMILLSQSGKEIDGIPTKGLYGLGFKSVFLVCDKPCVLSRNLRFKIVGGLLPEALDEDEDMQAREFTREFDAVPSGVKPTVFILPLRKDVQDDVATAVRHFAQEVKVLGIFSRRIRTINVCEPNGKRTSVDLRYGLNGSQSVRTCGADGEFLRIDTDEATLLIGAENGLPAPLPAEVATYWVTCPTSVKAGLGVAINANLKLDTGRLILDPKSVKNGELLARTAVALYDKLASWVEELPSSSRYEVLDALFTTFTGGSSSGNWDASHADARALFAVLWGERGAYRRILCDHAALPSGLEGEYRTLCSLKKIEWMVDDAVMKSGLVDAIGSSRFKPGHVVAREWFWNVGRIFFPDVVRGIPSYDVVRLLSDLVEHNRVLSSTWCTEINAERLYVLVKPQLESENVRKIVRCFEFVTVSGTGCKPVKLLIDEDGDDEQLRARFLPDANVLSHAYGDWGRKLVKLFRCEDYMSAPDLAGFALAATTRTQRDAVLKYLAEGQLSKAFLSALRSGSKTSWLENWQSHCDKDSMGKKGKAQVALALSHDDDEFETQLALGFEGGPDDGSPGDSTPPGIVYPIPSLVDVREWWADNRDEWLERYSYEAYGRSMEEVKPLTFDLQSKDSRSAWMEVLLLGAAHRMGFKLCQHKGFIGFLKRKGWWDEYCEHEVAPKRWLDTLDQYLAEEEFAGGEYGHWFNLFVRIYQFSRHLDTYVQLFETWNDTEECKKCDLASIKKNSRLRGSSIDAPGLQYALGQGTGLAFVYREMVRRGAIHNPVLHRFCFVPYPKVSEFGSCIRDSEEIFDKAVRELGRDDATFGLSFDIAITSYIKNKG